MNIYDEIPTSQIVAEVKYLQSAIFKLLPYKENNYEYLDGYFDSVLQRLKGFNKISCERTEIVTVISLIEYARGADNFQDFRKSVLDACGIMERIKESDSRV